MRYFILSRNSQGIQGPVVSGIADDSRAGLYHSLNDSSKILIVGTARILGIKLHILNKALGILKSQ